MCVPRVSLVLTPFPGLLCCTVRDMKRPMTKAAARKAEVKKPVAKKPKKSSVTYTPAPLQTSGRVPFRYPLQ